MNEVCELCKGGPAGESGHAHLVRCTDGSYGGHEEFWCSVCPEKWVRLRGFMTPFSWTRNSLQFAGRGR